MACQWTDEQTGGHCPTLAARFTGTDRKWFTFTNGTHIDSLDPATFNRWLDFLQIYVAKRPPLLVGAALHAAAPLVFQEAMGIPLLTLPADPIQLLPTYGARQGRLRAAEAGPDPLRQRRRRPPRAGPALPGLREVLRRAAGPRHPGQSLVPLAAAAASATSAPAAQGADEFAADPHALPKTDFTGNTASGAGGLWTALPEYHWEQNPAGKAVSYLTAPLSANTTVIGAGAVNLWVRSAAPNVDLQATISEVRPDGKETFVQNGWVRGNARKLDAAKSTPLEPVLSLRESDVEPLPPNEFVPVTIPLYYQGHAYRAGSRIRVTIAAPNGTQPIWAFDHAEPETGTTQVAIAYGAGHPLEPAAAGRPRASASRPGCRPARACGGSRAAPTRRSPTCRRRPELRGRAPGSRRGPGTSA